MSSQWDRWSAHITHSPCTIFLQIMSDLFIFGESFGEVKCAEFWFELWAQAIRTPAMLWVLSLWGPKTCTTLVEGSTDQYAHCMEILYVGGARKVLSVHSSTDTSRTWRDIAIVKDVTKSEAGEIKWIVDPMDQGRPHSLIWFACNPSRWPPPSRAQPTFGCNMIPWKPAADQPWVQK